MCHIVLSMGICVVFKKFWGVTNETTMNFCVTVCMDLSCHFFWAHTCPGVELLVIMACICFIWWDAAQQLSRGVVVFCLHLAVWESWLLHTPASIHYCRSFSAGVKCYLIIILISIFWGLMLITFSWACFVKFCGVFICCAHFVISD